MNNTSLKLNATKETLGKLTFFLKENIELIAALISGLLILAVWILGDYLSDAAWVTLHIIAFIIGGYAKAKEGINETVRSKRLNVEILMIIAAIGSVAIGFWTEGAILIFIFALSGALETYSMKKSHHAISSLMDLQPEEASLLTDKTVSTVPVSKLQLNDLILVRAGERIPADGVIVKGASAIDESALTGESIPAHKQTDQKVFSGTVALDGTITVKITTRSNETLFQKIIQLVQSAQEEKSPSQLFIEKFESIYVYAVLIAVGIMMFLPYLVFDWTLSESIYRAMVLLVVASPCALVASITPATLSAISNAAKKGILFKGGIHLENIGAIRTIAFDKTGTLTKGAPIVTDAFFTEKYNAKEIMAVVGAIESESNHPLATAITTYCIDRTESFGNINVFNMRNISGMGVTAVAMGKVWKIGKADFVGKQASEEFHNHVSSTFAKAGKTITFVKADEEVVAVFGLKDTLRETTKEAIATLKKANIETIMLTGDNEVTAEAIAIEAGVNRHIANCLPHEKVEHIKNLRENNQHVAMVGDGINDAPALTNANVGIAMGEGTDIALETADVVLMKNDLLKLNSAMQLSRRANRIIKQNIVFSLSIIMMLILTNYFQIIDLPLGVIGHEGSTILVILNGLRLLK